MKFVIELDDFACGAAERQVMRRGWEREPNRPQSAQFMPSKSKSGKWRRDQNGATRLPGVPAHTVK